MISVPGTVGGGALGVVDGFCQEFSRCLTARADALFELGRRCCAPRAPSPRWGSYPWLLSTGAGTKRCMTRWVPAGSTRRGYGGL